MNIDTQLGVDIWHRSFIEHIAFVAKPKVYLELGIRDCLVFNRVAQHCGHAIGVDIDPSSGKHMKGGNTNFHLGTTDSYAALIKASPFEIDMLFIDAEHTKEAVRKDFENFFPFVKNNGLILFHDTHPMNEENCKSCWSGDCWEVMNYIKGDYYRNQIEIMTLPFEPGLSLARKRKHQLGWKS